MALLCRALQLSRLTRISRGRVTCGTSHVSEGVPKLQVDSLRCPAAVAVHVNLNKKTQLVQQLALLLLFASGCSAQKPACEPFASHFTDVGWQCSGTLVRKVPQLLPAGLKRLQLAGTGLSSLDYGSFRGRRLQELTSLAVTDGNLTSVGANAFCALPALQMLYLDHNRLNKLDELSFACNFFLRVVSLVGNPTLRHLPRLLSPSVDHLYLDSCRLESIDIASIKGMTALKVLSLTGNPDLHCPSVKTRFQRQRPDLRVICEDNAGDLAARPSPDDEELTSKKLYTAPDITIKNTKSYTTIDEDDGGGLASRKSLDDEELTPEKLFTAPVIVVKNMKSYTTSDEHRASKSLVESDVFPKVVVNGIITVNTIIFIVVTGICILILVTASMLTVRYYFRKKIEITTIN